MNDNQETGEGLADGDLGPPFNLDALSQEIAKLVQRLDEFAGIINMPESHAGADQVAEVIDLDTYRPPIKPAAQSRAEFKLIKSGWADVIMPHGLKPPAA